MFDVRHENIYIKNKFFFLITECSAINMCTEMFVSWLKFKKKISYLNKLPYCLLYSCFKCFNRRTQNFSLVLGEGEELTISLYRVYKLYLVLKSVS
jgi:hypothetical protein